MFHKTFLTHYFLFLATVNDPNDLNIREEERGTARGAQTKNQFQTDSWSFWWECHPLLLKPLDIGSLIVGMSLKKSPRGWWEYRRGWPGTTSLRHTLSLCSDWVRAKIQSGLAAETSLWFAVKSNRSTRAHQNVSITQRCGQEGQAFTSASENRCDTNELEHFISP